MIRLVPVVALALLLLTAAGEPNHGRKLPATMAMYYLDVTPIPEPVPVGVAYDVKGCGFHPGAAHVVDASVVGNDEWSLDNDPATVGALFEEYRDEGDVLIGADGCMHWMYCPVRHNESDRWWTENHELLAYQQVRNRTVLMARLRFDVFSYPYEPQADPVKCIMHVDLLEAA